MHAGRLQSVSSQGAPPQPRGKTERRSLSSSSVAGGVSKMRMRICIFRGHKSACFGGTLRARSCTCVTTCVHSALVLIARLVGPEGPSTAREVHAGGHHLCMHACILGPGSFRHERVCILVDFCVRTQLKDLSGRALCSPSQSLACDVHVLLHKHAHIVSTPVAQKPMNLGMHALQNKECHCIEHSRLLLRFGAKVGTK